MEFWSYSENDWQRLSNRTGLNDLNILGQIRAVLEIEASAYLSSNFEKEHLFPAAPKRRKWDLVAARSLKLISAIESLETLVLLWGYPRDEKDRNDQLFFDQIIISLRDLTNRAESNAAMYARHASRFGGRKHPGREILFEAVFRIWEDVLKRELRFSRPASGGPPSGPLWNFFSDALEPILKSELPRPEGFKEIVSRARARRLERKRSDKATTTP